MAAGYSGQFTSMRLPVNTVIHTTLVGLEPATFRSLVDCWSDALPVVPPTHDTELIVSKKLESNFSNRLLSSKSTGAQSVTRVYSCSVETEVVVASFLQALSCLASSPVKCVVFKSLKDED